MPRHAKLRPAPLDLDPEVVDVVEALHALALEARDWARRVETGRAKGMMLERLSTRYSRAIFAFGVLSASKKP